MTDGRETLEKRWPDEYKELLKFKEKLEIYFKDVCDFEFTIQEKKVYLMQARIAKRTSRANLRFALQFFQEGKISIGDVLVRIRPEDIEDIASLCIKNKTKLTLLGKGLPASSGIATGKIALRYSDVEYFTQKKESFVFVVTEADPEDATNIRASAGVLTASGGRTSHVALICRGLEKPSVVGFDQMKINNSQRNITVSGGRVINSGDWITIDGITGYVYAGKGEFTRKRWQEYHELVALYEIVKTAIFVEKIPLDAIGWAWRMMDYFMHSVPFRKARTQKKQINRNTYISFIEPVKQNIDATRLKLVPISEKECKNYSQILLSFSEHISRLLSSAIGIGYHYRYFRPLWDPKTQIKKQTNEEAFQFIGFEYFQINRYVPHLVDISHIIFFLEVKLKSETDEWFLDFTNPKGESLVPNSDIITRCRILVNDAEVQHDDLPLFYNAIRRRELYWQWYKNRDVSYETIKKHLSNWLNGKTVDNYLLSCCEELGLIRNQCITTAGQSLLGKLERNRRYEFRRPQ
jgi:phosphohistidine swiveling domain-containing protein